ncbi:MAG: energy-coupling factor ABC transporter ATP-binding protein [Casimicrobium sp.]
MAETFVKLVNACVTVRDLAILRNVELSITAGERVAVLGANGAGKSTLLRLINGLVGASSGSVLSPAQSAQALIFQRPIMLKRSTLDNVAFALKARGVSRAEAIECAKQTLAHCRLEALANRPARSLSGGEQQKLALARAWALEPALLLADEPTASLAPAAVHDVEAMLKQIVGDEKTLVFATHNRGQAKRLATRVLFLHEGCVTEDRPVNDFFATPMSQPAIDYLNVEKV